MGFSRQEYWSGLPFSSSMDHILSDLSTMTCPSWVAPQGMTSFHWVRQGCGPSVIRLASFLWLWFQCVCPLMPSHNTCRLTLDVGYLFMPTPAKRSCCSLPWTRGTSSPLPLLTLNMDFILGGSTVTADGDCSHEVKRQLLLGRKVMTNLDSIFKSRDIILSTKIYLVKAMIFQ